MQLTSTAFENGGKIPSSYTCDGRNVSPPLEWNSIPEGTKSFALICDDPDAPAGVWVHWVYYDIPNDVTSLPENVPPDKRPLTGGIQGTNDFKKTGYGGPCPPGGTHRYFFKLYALDTRPDLPAGADKKQLIKAMKGHILEEVQLKGTYRR